MSNRRVWNENWVVINKIEIGVIKIDGGFSIRANNRVKGGFEKSGEASNIVIFDG